MYFKYSLEDDGEIITDGKQALARIQVKTEKLIKYAHEVEFFTGIKVKLRSNALWSAKAFEIFNERNEPIGSVKPGNDSKMVWLNMSDKLVLKNKYSFEVQSKGLQKSLVIRNESGTVIAQFIRKFIFQKMRNRLFIVEENLDNLVFEDRLFIYALAYVSRKLIN